MVLQNQHTFNSLTDSNYKLYGLSVGDYNFQFPNGFSRMSTLPLEHKPTIFQFPNGFSQFTSVFDPNLANTNFQFPNGFSQNKMFALDIREVKAFNSLTDSHFYSLYHYQRV